MQRTPIERLAEGVEARPLVAVPQVFQHQQGLVEEDLFGLGLRRAVLLVPAGVTVVPVEADDAREIDHLCTLSSYTRIAWVRRYRRTLEPWQVVALTGDIAEPAAWLTGLRLLG